MDRNGPSVPLVQKAAAGRIQDLFGSMLKSVAYRICQDQYDVPLNLAWVSAVPWRAGRKG